MDIIQNLKSAYDLAKGAIGLKNSIESDTKIRKVLDILFTAQNDAFSAQEEKAALIKEKRVLEEKIMQFEAWNTEKQRYQLINLGAYGTTAYAVKKSMCNAEPPHYICTNCYENREKSILQPKKRQGGRFMLVCPNSKCGFEFHLNYSREVPAKYV